MGLGPFSGTAGSVATALGTAVLFLAAAVGAAYIALQVGGSRHSLAVWGAMKIPALGILFGILAALFIGSVRAQEHRHPPQDAAVHEKFYRDWMMPDNRNISCCHSEDCAPAESRFENGQWVARRADDKGDFTPVPSRKIEHDRDTPDGRSHICGRRYGFGGGEFTVFCFIPGFGG